MRHKRLMALEGKATAKHGGSYVWIRPGQSQEDALKEAGLPADGRHQFFSWKGPQ